MAHSAGSNIGPYRIIEPVGRGGMASVFKAYEPSLDRYVALKVLPPEFLHDPTFAQRFRREAQTVARLEHPQIIPIFAYDIDTETGTPWMAMRLISGGSLSQRIKRGRLAPFECARILKDVADALDYAHGAGVIHRDVKPQNVLLDDAGRVYLADFGIARMVEAGPNMTQTGMITGTPQYMAPEQALSKSIGKAVDIYALGIVAYELFTGSVPFSADTPVAVLMKQASEPMPLPPPSEVKEDVTRAILRATAKDPAARWPSASAFAKAITSAVTSVNPEAATLAMPALDPTVADGMTVPVVGEGGRSGRPGPRAAPSSGEKAPATGLATVVLLLALMAVSTAFVAHRYSLYTEAAVTEPLAAPTGPTSDDVEEAATEFLAAHGGEAIKPDGEGATFGSTPTPSAADSIEESHSVPEAPSILTPPPEGLSPIERRALLGRGPVGPKERIEAMVAARRERGLPMPGDRAGVGNDRLATQAPRPERTRIRLEVQASRSSTGSEFNAFIGEVRIDDHPYRRFMIRFDGDTSKTENILLDAVPLSAREIKVSVVSRSRRGGERTEGSTSLALRGEETALRVQIRLYGQFDKSIEFR